MGSPLCFKETSMPNDSLVIKSTFFTELSGISQSSGNGFGPVGTTTAEKEQKYRVTSILTATGTKKAFAICKGRCFIQPQDGNANKVNLILKPLFQPSSRLPIKFFVYRGLDKSSFFDSSTTPAGDIQLITNANSASASDFVQSVWARFKEFHQLPANTTDPLEAKWIGYDPATQTSTDLIDKYFYKVSTDDLEDASDLTKLFEPHVVNEGQSIGTFSGDFGLDVVIDYGDIPITESGFNFDLAYARATSWEFDTTNTPTGVLEKTFRENILYFMDPCALWGLHYSESGSITTIDSTGTSTIQTITNDDIYNNVVSIFDSKNSVYLKVFCDRGKSYNYYDRHFKEGSTTDSIKIGYSTGNTSDTAYGTFKWPVIISNITQNHTNDKNSIFLQLTTDGTSIVNFYCNLGVLDSSNKNGFSSRDDLVTEGNTFTNEIQFSVPAIDNGQSGRINIASEITANYRGKFYKIPIHGLTDEYLTLGYNDDILPLPSSTSVYETPVTPHVSKVSSSQISVASLYALMPDNPGHMAFSTSITTDFINHSTDDQAAPVERILFETNPINFYTESELLGQKPSPENQSGVSLSYPFSSEKNNYYKPRRPYNLLTRALTTYPEPTKTCSLFTEGTSSPLKLALGISKAEYDVLLALVVSNTLTNVRLIFDSFDQNTSQDSVNYVRQNIGIIGDDTNGDTRVFLPSDPIYVFSTDKYFFVSVAYAQHMPLTPENLAISLDDDPEDDLVDPEDSNTASLSILLHVYRGFKVIKQAESTLSDVKFNIYGIVSKFTFQQKKYRLYVKAGSKDEPREFSAYYEIGKYEEYKSREAKAWEYGSIMFKYAEALQDGQVVEAEKGDIVSQQYIDASGLYFRSLKWAYDGTTTHPPFTENAKKGTPVPIDTSGSSFDYENALSGPLTIHPSAKLLVWQNEKKVNIDPELENFYKTYAGKEGLDGDIINPIVIVKIAYLLSHLKEKVKSALAYHGIWSAIVDEEYDILNDDGSVDDYALALYSNKDFARLRNELISYKKVLTEFYNKIEEFESVDEAKYYLARFFTEDALKIIPVDDKILILKLMAKDPYEDPIDGSYEGETKAQLAVKMVKAVDVSNLTETEKFLSALLAPIPVSVKKSKTINKSLYQAVYDQIMEIETNPFNIGEVQQSRRDFIDGVYSLWVNSTRNPYYNPSSGSDPFDGNKLDQYTYHEDTAPILLPYEAQSWYELNVGHFDFHFIDSGTKISVSKFYSEEEVIDKAIESGDWEKANKLIKDNNVGLLPNSLEDTYGTYDLFQPVSLMTSADEDLKTQLPFLQQGFGYMLPVFYLMYYDDKQDLQNLITRCQVAVDVVTTLTGIGNISKLRHLRHLGKVMNLRGTASASATKLLRAEIASGLGAFVELTQSTAAAVLEYFDDELCANASDPSNCAQQIENLKNFLFWAELATLSVDFTVIRSYNKSVKKLVDDGLPDNFPTSAVAELTGNKNVIDQLYDTFKTDWTTGGKNYTNLINSTDTLTDAEKLEFIQDFQNLRRKAPDTGESLDIFKRLDDEIGAGNDLVPTWKTLKEIGLDSALRTDPDALSNISRYFKVRGGNPATYAQELAKFNKRHARLVKNWAKIGRKLENAFTGTWDIEKVKDRIRLSKIDPVNHPPINPSDYLTTAYINSHKQKFNNGAAFFVSEDTLKWLRSKRDPLYLGFDDNSQFVFSADELSNLLNRTGKNVDKIETELGIPTGQWAKSKMTIIEVDDLNSLNTRMPSGYEAGVIPEEWLPGGLTPNGSEEAIVDNIYQFNEIPLNH